MNKFFYFVKNFVCVKINKIEAGADVLVAGSFVFNAENPQEAIASIKK